MVVSVVPTLVAAPSGTQVLVVQFQTDSVVGTAATAGQVVADEIAENA